MPDCFVSLRSLNPDSCPVDSQFGLRWKSIILNPDVIFEMAGETEESARRLSLKNVSAETFLESTLSFKIHRIEDLVI